MDPGNREDDDEGCDCQSYDQSVDNQSSDVHDQASVNQASVNQASVNQASANQATIDGLLKKTQVGSQNVSSLQC